MRQVNKILQIYILGNANVLNNRRDLQMSRRGVAHWVARLTRNVEVVGSSPIKAPVVSLSKKETLPLLLIIGWFQEQIRA